MHHHKLKNNGKDLVTGKQGQIISKSEPRFKIDEDIHQEAHDIITLISTFEQQCNFDLIELTPDLKEQTVYSFPNSDKNITNIGVSLLDEQTYVRTKINIVVIDPANDLVDSETATVLIVQETENGYKLIGDGRCIRDGYRIQGAVKFHFNKRYYEAALNNADEAVLRVEEKSKNRVHKTTNFRAELDYQFSSHDLNLMVEAIQADDKKTFNEFIIDMQQLSNRLPLNQIHGPTTLSHKNLPKANPLVPYIASEGDIDPTPYVDLIEALIDSYYTIDTLFDENKIEYFDHFFKIIEVTDNKTDTKLKFLLMTFDDRHTTPDGLNYDYPGVDAHFVKLFAIDEQGIHVVSHDYGTTTYPVTGEIDHSGKVIFHHDGKGYWLEYGTDTAFIKNPKGGDLEVSSQFNIGPNYDSLGKIRHHIQGLNCRIPEWETADEALIDIPKQFADLYETKKNLKKYLALKDNVDEDLKATFLTKTTDEELLFDYLLWNWYYYENETISMPELELYKVDYQGHIAAEDEEYFLATFFEPDVFNQAKAAIEQSDEQSGSLLEHHICDNNHHYVGTYSLLIRKKAGQFSIIGEAYGEIHAKTRQIIINDGVGFIGGTYGMFDFTYGDASYQIYKENQDGSQDTIISKGEYQRILSSKEIILPKSEHEED